jgi:hypothetical protein
MSNSLRWILFLSGIVLVVGVIYGIFFHIWPFYPVWGWRYHSFGPRMWPVFPFFGMLILIVAGILVAKYFFQALRAPSLSKKDELTFCPNCGKDLNQDKTIPEVHAEKV